MKRARPRQHIRRLKKGRKIVVNKGVKKRKRSLRGTEGLRMRSTQKSATKNKKLIGEGVFFVMPRKSEMPPPAKARPVTKLQLAKPKDAIKYARSLQPRGSLKKAKQILVFKEDLRDKRMKQVGEVKKPKGEGFVGIPTERRKLDEFGNPTSVWETDPAATISRKEEERLGKLTPLQTLRMEKQIKKIRQEREEAEEEAKKPKPSKVPPGFPDYFSE